jgi:hypothetical protein
MNNKLKVQLDYFMTLSEHLRNENERLREEIKKLREQVAWEKLRI